MHIPNEEATQRARTCAIALGLISVLLAPGAATAQSPTPPPAEPIALRFVGGPLWHEPGDALGLRLRVVNPGSDPLEGFRVIVGIEDRVLNRSSLEAAFQPDSGIASSALPFEFDDVVPERDSVTVTLDEALSNFPTLAGATEGGVYPANLTLQDASGSATFASAKVPLIYYPQRPETALNIAVAILLNELPTRLAGGSYITEHGSTPLVEALAENGWLTNYLGLLEPLSTPQEPEPSPPGSRRRGRRSRPPAPPPEPLHVSLGMTPRLIDDLAGMADGFQRDDDTTFAAGTVEAQRARRALNDLSSLLGLDNVQPILIPYAFPDLPSIVRELPVDHTLEQFNKARTLLRQELDLEGEGAWLFPPAGRLDAPSLDAAKRAGSGEAVLLSHDSLVEPESLVDVGCPESSPSFTCPVVVETVLGETPVLVSDPGLSERLSWLPLRTQDRLSLQQFFAETAMIREELPGVPGRVIQATIPSLWHPTRHSARVLLRGIKDAPWLNDVTADTAFDLREPVERDIIDEARRVAVEPDPFFFESIENATDVIDSYQTVVPPDNRRLARLRANILAAQDRTLWRLGGSAEEYVRASQEEAEAELHKIGLEGAEDLTCTSRECRVQLVLTNETTYPVEVSVELESPDLELRLPSVEDVFEPGSHPLAFDATVRGSGIFRLAARLRSADRDYLIQEKRIVIRSTNFNRIALAITVGAFAFLVLFYLTRPMRRRRAKVSEE